MTPEMRPRHQMNSASEARNQNANEVAIRGINNDMTVIPAENCMYHCTPFFSGVAWSRIEIMETKCIPHTATAEKQTAARSRRIRFRKPRGDVRRPRTRRVAYEPRMDTKMDATRTPASGRMGTARRLSAYHSASRTLSAGCQLHVSCDSEFGGRGVLRNAGPTVAPRSRCVCTMCCRTAVAAARMHVGMSVHHVAAQNDSCSPSTWSTFVAQAGGVDIGAHTWVDHMHRARNTRKTGITILTTPEVLRRPLGPHDGRLRSRRRRTSVKLPSGVREALRMCKFSEMGKRRDKRCRCQDEGGDEAAARCEDGR